MRFLLKLLASSAILTLGLFLLVLNALIILIASHLIGHRFVVDGFWWALLFSLIVSLFNSLINLPEKRRNQQIN